MGPSICPVNLVCAISQHLRTNRVSTKLHADLLFQERYQKMSLASKALIIKNFNFIFELRFEWMLASGPKCGL